MKSQWIRPSQLRIAIANPKSSSTAMLHLIKLALTVDMKLCRETYSGYKTIIVLLFHLIQFWCKDWFSLTINVPLTTGY